MAHNDIRDLILGRTVTDYYMVKSKRMQKTRQGKPYLDLTLQDASGTVESKLWEDAELYDGQFERGDVVKVQADVDEWQNRMQFRIKRLRKAEESDNVDLSVLIPCSEQDTGEMLDYLREVAGDLQDPYLRDLLATMLDDPDFIEVFERSAAARDLHHVYQGGLLEHTVNMLKVAKFVTDEIYPDLDQGLVLCGVILHDIGKTQELDSKGEIAYTTEGYLLGHLYIGTKILHKYAAMLPEFPEELLTRLEHIILSHHGEKEWGSPVVPMTAEAMIIHHLDNLDAKTNMVLKAIDSDQNLNEEFTAYHRTLRRHFYKGQGPDNKKNNEPDS